MKKFIFLVLSICLCAMFTLSGCSCAPETILEFNNSRIKDISKETLKYSVTLDKNYKDIKRSSIVSENLLPEFRNGLYVSEYQAEEYFENDFLSKPGEISKIRTCLTIDVVDTKGTSNSDDDKIYKDQILSEVYFYTSQWSFAPIYSKTTVKNTYTAIENDTIEFAHMIYQYETTYTNSSYVITKKYYNKAEGEDITKEMDLNALDTTKLLTIEGDSGKTQEYSFRQVIDNNQLIFATRNLDIAKDSNAVLPVVNYMYSKPSKLQILNQANSTHNFETALNYSYLGTNKVYPAKELSMPIKNIRISLVNTDYVGMPKYVSVQNDTADEGKILNNGLVIEYAEALTNASYHCLGALVYRLVDVNII